MSTLAVTRKTIAVEDVRPGMVLSLAGDKYADPPGGFSIFEFEYGVVVEVEQETDECVVISFEGEDVGFPTGHKVTRILF